METAYFYLALSGVLTLLLWIPYIIARLFLWGLPAFLNNYPVGYPAVEPEPPLWAQRAKRAHLNLVETLPAFIAVLIPALAVAKPGAELIGNYCELFFYARLMHAVVYTVGLPYLRTPAYLISWVAVLLIAAEAVV